MLPNHRALPILLSGAIFLGLSPILFRLSEVGPLAAAFWRALFALPLLALMLRREAAPLQLTRQSALPLMFCGLFYAGDLGIYHESVRLTSVANATLLSNLAPVLVAFASYRLAGERFRPLFIGGLTLTLFGAALLVVKSVQLGPSNTLGDAYGLLSAVFCAGYLYTATQARAQVGTVTLLFWTTLVMALSLLPLALLRGEVMLPQTVNGWMALGALALFCHVLGTGQVAYALAHLPAAFSSVGMLLQPVSAAILAWLFLAEPLGPLQALGGAVVLGGIAVCRLSAVYRVPAALNTMT